MEGYVQHPAICQTIRLWFYGSTSALKTELHTRSAWYKEQNLMTALELKARHDVRYALLHDSW